MKILGEQFINFKEMRSYENLILKLLHGQTPQQKYNYLVNLI